MTTLTGETDGLIALAFSEDGATLHTATTDSVRNWDIRTTVDVFADPTNNACTAAGGGLTSEQWSSLIPGLPFQSTC